MVFFPVNAVAVWLMVPHIAWVSFAAILNREIWRADPGLETLKLLSCINMDIPLRRSSGKGA
jgi:uncharacterized membrane protein (DUF4010 family)